MQNKLLAPENVCLQVVDVQKTLMSKIHGVEKVSSTVELMIRCSQVLGIPVVANTQYKKGLGPYVENVETLVTDIPQFDKVEFNAVANKETETFIDGLPQSVTTIALVGVETHICIYQTAMGLLQKGLDVWVVTDGVSSRNLDDHRDGLARLQTVGASLGPAEMLIYELLGKAGSQEFKQILPFIIGRDQ